MNRQPAVRSTSPQQQGQVEFDVTPLAFRSATEQSMNQEILAKVGAWDPASQSYRTREKQLQERTKAFQVLHSTLRFMPAQQYALDARSTTSKYPNAPHELMKTFHVKNAELTLEDPTTDNILLRREIAEKNRGLRQKRPNRDAPGLLSNPHEALATLEAQLLSAAAHGGATPAPGSHYSGHSMTKTSASRDDNSTLRAGKGPTGAHNVSVDGTDASAVSRARLSQQRAMTPLPKVSEEHAYHSSLVRQLKMTRTQAEQFRHEHSTVRALLDLDTTADMKRVISRMFADPDRAASISQEAHELREQAYVEERQRALRYQMDLLKEERALMEKELATLSKT